MHEVTLKIATAAQHQLHHNGLHYLHDGQEQMAQGMHHYDEESLRDIDELCLWALRTHPRTEGLN